MSGEEERLKAVYIHTVDNNIDNIQNTEIDETIPNYNNFQ
jgi:hypothetical protein